MVVAAAEREVGMARSLAAERPARLAMVRAFVRVGHQLCRPSLGSMTHKDFRSARPSRLEVRGQSRPEARHEQ